MDASLDELHRALQDRIQREVDFIREVTDGITSALADINEIIEPLLLSHSEEQIRLTQIKERLDTFTHLLQEPIVITPEPLGDIHGRLHGRGKRTRKLNRSN